MTARPQKITFAEMRDMGVRGVLVYCADYHCSHLIAVMADRWADDLRLSDIEPRFICSACGKRRADVRPDFNWNKVPVKGDGLSPPSKDHLSVRAIHSTHLRRSGPQWRYALESESASPRISP